MKFSVLIPVYNVEDYLEECISSVLRQPYQDVEIVLVNDGSSDGSSKICDQFRKSYPERVKVIHKCNEGVVLARKDAISAASGDVVVFLDADDCLRDDALMRLHEAFEKHQCGMVIYNYSTVSDFGSTCADVPFPNDVCMEGEDKKQVYKLLCDVSYLNGLCFKAVRREIAEVLLEHSEWQMVTNGEDLLCTLPMVTKAERIVYLDQPLYYYRQRPGSTTHSFHYRRLRSIKTVHQIFEKYIDLWQMPALHARHYAREVRGWAETLKLLMQNRESMGKEVCHAVLEEMAEDPYFRNAYARMDATQLSKDVKLFSGFLYRRMYFLIYLMHDMISLARAVRKKSAPEE